MNWRDEEEEEETGMKKGCVLSFGWRLSKVSRATDSVTLFGKLIIYIATCVQALKIPLFGCCYTQPFQRSFASSIAITKAHFISCLT